MYSLLMTSFIGANILTGIISSLFATIFLSLIVFICKPRIKIIKHVCASRKNINNTTNYIVKIKVVNLSPFLISSIQYETYLKHTDTANQGIKELNKYDSTPNVIIRYSRKDSENSFATILAFVVSEEDWDKIFMLMLN